jgi:hypothetical protein
MTRAIGEILPLAIGIAISPLPIIAVILMLATPRARTNGPAFLAGWLLGLAVVATTVLIVTDAAGVAASSGRSHIVSVLVLLLGLLLLVLAWRQYRGRPGPGEEEEAPKWMKALDGFTATRSLAVGALFSGVKPKNLILTAAAAASIAQSGIAGSQQIVVLVVLVIIASVGMIVPVAVCFAMGDRSGPLLDGWKAWLSANNATVMIVLFLVFGVLLLGKGIGGL